jgi:hypothetical protein
MAKERATRKKATRKRPTKKKATKKKPSREVQAFANALQEWAAHDKQRETLLKWLLSRCESRRFEGSKGKYVIKRRSIKDINVKDAVRDALAGYNPDLPTSGWVRGGPIWARAYGDIWSRAYGP